MHGEWVAQELVNEDAGEIVDVLVFVEPLHRMHDSVGLRRDLTPPMPLHHMAAEERVIDLRARMPLASTLVAGLRLLILGPDLPEAPATLVGMMHKTRQQKAALPEVGLQSLDAVVLRVAALPRRVQFLDRVAFSSGATFASRLLRRMRPQPRHPSGAIPNRALLFAYPYGTLLLVAQLERIDARLVVLTVSESLLQIGSCFATK